MVMRSLVAAAGVLMVVVALTVLVRPPAGADIGVLDLATPTATAAPSPAATATPRAPQRPLVGLDGAARRPRPDNASMAPWPPATPEPPDVAVESGRLSDLPAAEPTVAPVRLRLPGLGLDVPIVAVGVAADGQMEVPADVDDVGWYRFGPQPGQPGHAVVAGHVDDREQGLGPFRQLVDLAEGDDVVVTAADGTRTRWRVSARRTIDKAALEADDIFSRTGPPRLVLVTCGGEFDADARSYRSNVVVVADLL